MTHGRLNKPKDTIDSKKRGSSQCTRIKGHERRLNCNVSEVSLRNKRSIEGNNAQFSFRKDCIKVRRQKHDHPCHDNKTQQE